MSFVRTSLALLLGSLAIAQFVPEPSGFTSKTGYANIPVRYKEVPTGICELDPTVKSYSGYADVAENEHVFFWFFEARNEDPKKAPLSVWINGGPGSTSMYGLWQELGPCGVDYNGDVYSNPWSWTNVSNMIFIDQPVTVGFSYSIPIKGLMDAESGEVTPLNGTDCPQNTTQLCGTWSTPDETYVPNSTAAAAPNVWKTLQGFMGVFPEYTRHGFHFTTESYGGHYGPVFNEYFEQQNAALPYGAHKISLETVTIGNGWYDPLIQYQAYYNYTVSPGNTYDYSPYNDTVAQQLFDSLYGAGNCTDGVRQCYAQGNDTQCSNIDSFCAQNVEEVLDIVASRDEYDIRELSTSDNVDPFPYGFFADYLNTPNLQSAIGAFTNFSAYSATVGDAFAATGDDSRESSTIEDIRKLLTQKVTVLQYAGDADYNCNWLGGEVVSNEIAAPNFDKAGYVDIVTTDGICHGQVRQAANYAFARIYESGHEVPFYQPVVALEMFYRAIQHKDIATGKQSAELGGKYYTKGAPKSTYREGNSTVQSDVLDPNAEYSYDTNKPLNESAPPLPYPFPTVPATGISRRSLSGMEGRSALLRPRKVKGRGLLGLF